MPVNQAVSKPKISAIAGCKDSCGPEKAGIQNQNIKDGHSI